MIIERFIQEKSQGLKQVSCRGKVRHHVLESLILGTRCGQRVSAVRGAAGGDFTVALGHLAWWRNASGRIRSAVRQCRSWCASGSSEQHRQVRGGDRQRQLRG